MIPNGSKIDTISFKISRFVFFSFGVRSVMRRLSSTVDVIFCILSIVHGKLFIFISGEFEMNFLMSMRVLLKILFTILKVLTASFTFSASIIALSTYKFCSAFFAIAESIDLR